MTLSSSERGSVFLYILIAVALFTALGYAVATSMRGNSNASQDRTRLMATEIIDTGNLFAEAVTRLRLHEVSKKAISFENDLDAAYLNPNCTTDACRIFANDGGGLTVMIPPANLTPAPWFFSGSLAIDGVGTTAGDLVVYLSYLPADVCSQINELLGNTTKGEAIPLVASSLTNVNEFAGTFDTTMVTTPKIVGKMAGCVQVSSITGTTLGTAVNAYHFYQVLLAN